jgi:hypothetical protein
MDYDLTGYSDAELQELRSAMLVDAETFKGSRKLRDSYHAAMLLVAHCDDELARRLTS